MVRPTVHGSAGATAGRLGVCGDSGPTKMASIIEVVGGSGGVGASVLSAAIAVRAAQAGLRSVAVDGDRLGGGLDVTLGIERERGARWPDLPGPGGVSMALRCSRPFRR
jgi:Mrp family chromosome partitioning ATPase